MELLERGRCQFFSRPDKSPLGPEMHRFPANPSEDHSFLRDTKQAHRRSYRNSTDLESCLAMPMKCGPGARLRGSVGRSNQLLQRRSETGASPVRAGRQPITQRAFFLARFSAFFSAFVFNGCFFVCFWESCVLAMILSY
jgi:hypothetical protein